MLPQLKDMAAFEHFVFLAPSSYLVYKSVVFYVSFLRVPIRIVGLSSGMYGTLSLQVKEGALEIGNMQFFDECI